jgi:hypothetical protein
VLAVGIDLYGMSKASLPGGAQASANRCALTAVEVVPQQRHVRKLGETLQFVRASGMGTVVDQDHGQAVDADAVHHRRDGVLVIENGNDDARGEHAIDHAFDLCHAHSTAAQFNCRGRQRTAE